MKSNRKECVSNVPSVEQTKSNNYALTSISLLENISLAISKMSLLADAPAPVL